MGAVHESGARPDEYVVAVLEPSGHRRAALPGRMQAESRRPRLAAGSYAA
jgi:hypothetical protein